jgi:hypothetical protein
VLSSYFPTNEMSALQARLDVLETNGRILTEQIAAVNGVADKAVQTAAAVNESAKAAASGLSEVSARVDAADSRLAALEQSLNTATADLAALRTAVSQSGGGGAGTGNIDSAALAALGQRIEALEKDVASLKSAGGSGAVSAAAALSQALSDIKAKVAAGSAFAEEYDRIALMVPAAPGLDVLAAHATQGLPNAQGLAAELSAAIPALPQPAAPSPAADDGYWDSFVSLLSGIVTIREIGETDWPALAQRCADLAQSGSLTQAISAIEAAEGSKPSALVQWQERAAARLRLEEALIQVSDAVVRQITALGGAQ